jgi:hypothetical protein
VSFAKYIFVADGEFVIPIIAGLREVEECLVYKKYNYFYYNGHSESDFLLITFIIILVYKKYLLLVKNGLIWLNFDPKTLN